MKFVGSTRHASPEALTAIQRRLAGHHSIELWPKDLYESLYSATKWPNTTIHKLRDPDLVKGVLVDHADCFEKAPSVKKLLQPVLGEGLITADGDAWKRQRTIMTAAFKRGALNFLTPFVSHSAQSAMATLALAHPHAIEVLPVMSRLTFEVICCLSFGSPTNDGMPYEETVNALRVSLDGTAANDPSTLERASESLRAMASAAINNRRKVDAAGTDLFSILIGATGTNQDLPPVSQTEFRDNILTIIVAGHETTAVAATWALYLLSRHPDVQEELAGEIRGAFPDGELTADVEKLPLLRRVILESMRLFPPIPTIARMAVRPITIGGIQFDPGDIADILVYPMHRNKLIWNDPDKFDPDRFKDGEARSRSKFAYIPFGAGPRICIGSQLTHLQVSIILGVILRDCTVSSVEGYDPKPQVRVTLQPHDGMPLHFARRSPIR